MVERATQSLYPSAIYSGNYCGLLLYTNYLCIPCCMCTPVLLLLCPGLYVCMSFVPVPLQQLKGKY